MNQDLKQQIKTAVEREALALRSDSCVSDVIAYLADQGFAVYLTGGRAREAALKNSYNGDVDLVVKGSSSLSAALEHQFTDIVARGRLGGMKIRFEHFAVDIIEWDQLITKNDLSIFYKFNAFNNCALISMDDFNKSLYDRRFFTSNCDRILHMNPEGFRWMGPKNRNISFLKTLNLTITSRLYVYDAVSIAGLLREAMSYDPITLTSLIGRISDQGRVEEAARLQKAIDHD